MRDLANLIFKNAEAAGRELGHALSDYNQDLAEAIGKAQDEQIDAALVADGVGLISDSPVADLSFLGFNHGRNAARTEG